MVHPKVRSRNCSRDRPLQFCSHQFKDKKLNTNIAIYLLVFAWVFLSIYFFIEWRQRLVK